LSKKKKVITGGAGFIGSHIAEYWSNQNAEVIVLDNLRSGYKKNIESLSNVTFINGSITDKKLVDQLLRGADYVHHLAAMISVPAKKHNVKKIVHSSSAAVYGDNPESPKYTDMKPQPKSPYGITKLDGEYYLQMYTESFGLNTTSLRYFNVFGPRQDPKSQYAAAIPIFVASALKNEDIVIYGDGEQTRDFVYVKDVVQANVLAVTNESLSGVFNVGNGYSISINKLVEMVLSLTKSSSKIIYKEVRPGDIKHSLASIDETKEKLSFSPKFDLLEGLDETIKYFIMLFKQNNK